MTTIKDVEQALSELSNENDLAKKWINNDIVKRKLATSYDAWMKDVWDHKYPISLKEHIETCLDEPEYIRYIESPTE